MMTHDARGRISVAAVFLLPLALVKGTSMLLMGGPQTAGAKTVNVARAPLPELGAAEGSWSAQQIAATRHIAEVRARPFGPTPLYHVERRAEDPPPQQDDPPPVREVPPPDFAVKMILKSDTGNVALINRKYYKVGDPLGDRGWIVTRIDSDGRSVVISHPPTNRTHTLRVPMPR